MVMHPEISLWQHWLFPCLVPGTSRDYIAFSFDSMDKDKLSSDIEFVCSLLNKGQFIVGCPNHLLSDGCFRNFGEKIGTVNGDFFFMSNDLRFISDLNLISTRRLTIYNLRTSDYDKFDLRIISKRASFIVVLENYLEVSHIFIKKADYGKEIEELKRRCGTGDGSVSQSNGRSDKQ